MQFIDFSSRMLTLFLAGAAWLMPALAHARDAFPSQPITIVVAGRARAGPRNKTRSRGSRNG
jgi:hypothetical protein